MALKKKHKIILGVLAILAVILISVNSIVSHIVHSRFQDLITDQKIDTYKFALKGTRFNLIDRSLELSEISVMPTDSAMAVLIKGNSSIESLHQIEIKRIKLTGIRLLPLLFSKEIYVKKLLVDHPDYHQFGYPKSKKQTAEKGELNIDSIPINHFGGLKIQKISLRNLKTKITDLKTEKLRFENHPFDFDITGFQLVQIDHNLFRLRPVGDLFEISKIKVQFPKRHYAFSIDRISYDQETDVLSIKKSSLRPTKNKAVLAQSYQFNDDVYQLMVDDIKLFKINFKDLIQNGSIKMDSAVISGVDFEVYKDKRKPFNKNKRPKLLHDLVKNSKSQILIPTIKVKNSRLAYEERLKKRDILMKVNMTNLESEITNISNLPEFNNQPMKISARTQFMGKADLKVNLSFPMQPDQNMFYYSGHLGQSKLKYYDSAIIPALGLKVLEGEIQSMSFQASADDYAANGSMTMLYNKLEAEVLKSESDEKSGFLSWSVNQLVHKSNPGANGKTRVVDMNFERVHYKGFWNYFWKTLQSGIINTIAPFGVSEEKAGNKKERKKKRQEKKKNKRN